MHHPHFSILIDNEPVPISDRTLTVRALLLLVGLDPDCFYLIHVKGRHQESYRDRLDVVLELHADERFVTSRIDAICPVS